MAFELRDDLEGSLGVDVPMDVFLQRMTLEELAAVVVELFEAKQAEGDGTRHGTESSEEWIEGAL